MCHVQQKGPTKRTNSPTRPETVLAQAHGPGSLIFSNHHQTRCRPSALPSPAFSSYSIFCPVGVCFLWSLTRFVPLTTAQFLLLPWLLHPDPWPALKPTAQATGTAVQISQLQFRPFLPHPWLPDPAQSPIPAYCVIYL